jgi:hypothetical protein
MDGDLDELTGVLEVLQIIPVEQDRLLEQLSRQLRLSGRPDEAHGALVNAMTLW